MNPDNTCANDCPTNYFKAAQECTACHQSCATCGAGLSTSCLTCSGSLYLTSDGSCVETCTNGWFKGSNNVCVSCESSCLTCDSIGSCLTCPTSNYLLTALNGSVSCANSCPSGYYTKTDGLSCDSRIILSKVSLTLTLLIRMSFHMRNVRWSSCH